MFQVESPDEGTTGGLTFVATLSGAFAVKSANDLADEYIGTKLLKAAGVPTPAVRMTFPGDKEHGCILKAVEDVAKQYSRRGDAEGAGSIMMHGLTSMRKFDGPLLLMEVILSNHSSRRPPTILTALTALASLTTLTSLAPITQLIPSASTLNQLGDRAKTLLEPDGDACACTRLEYIGRLWVLDAVLNFRDRFASQLSDAKYRSSVASAKSQEEQVSLTGNCDNVLFTDDPTDPSGITAIDSHIKLTRGEHNGAARSSSSALLRHELSSLLAENPNNPASFEWLRFTVKVVSGHSLSDEALTTARSGALRGLFALSSAVEFTRAEVRLDKERNAAGAKRYQILPIHVTNPPPQVEAAIPEDNEKWTASLARIDTDALASVAEDVESLLSNHGDMLLDLPPLPSCLEAGGKLNRPISTNVLSEAELVGAHPRLWDALSDGLQKALVNERILGVSPGPHSTGDFWFHEQDEKD